MTAVAVSQHLISRRDAKRLGKTRYFSGKVCPRGHVAERSVANGTCLVCTAIKKREHYSVNRDNIRAQSKARRAANKDVLKSIHADYYSRNKERVRERQKVYSREHSKSAVQRAKNWRERNPDKVRAKVVRRRANKLTRLPKWYGEFDEFVWREAANLVRLRGKLTQIKWHADHTIPLMCNEASGLHVAANCQVIPANLNIRKANALLLLTPGEWIFHS